MAILSFSQPQNLPKHIMFSPSPKVFQRLSKSELGQVLISGEDRQQNDLVQGRGVAGGVSRLVERPTVRDPLGIIVG